MLMCKTFSCIGLLLSTVIHTYTYVCVYIYIYVCVCVRARVGQRFLKISTDLYGNVNRLLSLWFQIRVSGLNFTELV